MNSKVRMRNVLKLLKLVTEPFKQAVGIKTGPNNFHFHFAKNSDVFNRVAASLYVKWFSSLSLSSTVNSQGSS